MKLFSVLAATAAAAAVAAALSLPAGADQSSDRTATALAACLHAHGAADAPSGDDAIALKQWLGAHQDDAAVKACSPQGPDKLVACLRSHGLNPPADLSALKPWLVQQSSTDSGRATLHACGADVGRDAPAKPPADCGGGAPALAPTPAAKPTT
jgi:hypothetical protein